MQRIILILSGILLFNTNIVLGQNQMDSVHIEKRLGTVFIQNGQTLTPKQLMMVTEIEPEAYEYMKKAKINSTFGTIFSSVGGFLIGWPIGTWISGGEPNWALAGIGAGVTALSIPFVIGYSKNAKKAVKIYNAGIPQPSSQRLEFKLQLTGNGIGVSMMF